MAGPPGPIIEGAVRLDLPEGTSGGAAGPGARKDAPFYNPAMAGTRDVSVLMVAALVRQRPELSFLDALCASGVRGVRVAVEGGATSVTCNDHNADAVALASSVAKANKVDHLVDVRHGDTKALLVQDRWDVVDIDPFGSPVPFLAGAIGAVRNGGHLAMSGTDTAALHGARPDAGRRRYLGTPPPREAPGWHEAALRYLAGAVVRLAAQQDIAATPVLLHTWDHSVRATFEVRAGARRADAALQQVGSATLCSTCQGWDLAGGACPCGKGRATGPYWRGPLHGAAFVRSLLREAGPMRELADERVARLIERCTVEAELPPLYHDLHRLAKAAGIGRIPRTEAVVAALHEGGYTAAVPHADPRGLKTDAPYDAVVASLRSAGA